MTRFARGLGSGWREQGSRTESAIIIDVLASVIGETPADAVSMETYGSTLTYRAELSDGTVYVKAAANADVAVEAWTCMTARAAGVPAPEVLAVADSPRLPGGKALVMRALAGRGLRDDDPPELVEDAVRQAGETLARLHEIRLPGWGALTPGPTPSPAARGVFATWHEALYAELTPCLDLLVNAGQLPTAIFDLVAESLDRARAGKTSTLGALCHGDLNRSTLFVDDGGQLTGIADFGDSLIAEPRFDLARFAVDVGQPDNELLTAALCAGLGYPPFDPTDELYRATWATIEAAWSLHFDMPWTPDMCSRALKGFEDLAARD